MNTVPPQRPELSVSFPDSLVPILDEDVVGVPRQYGRLSDDTREAAVRSHEQGRPDDPLLNLLQERLHEGYSFSRGGRLGFRAGKLLGTMVAEDKYRRRWGLELPHFGPEGVAAGTAAVVASRRAAQEASAAALEDRIRVQELRYLGSDAIARMHRAIASGVREHLHEAQGSGLELDAQALHLGIVESLIFFNAALAARWGFRAPVFPLPPTSPRPQQTGRRSYFRRAHRF
jgi:hypothetical protein